MGLFNTVFHILQTNDESIAENKASAADKDFDMLAWCLNLAFNCQQLPKKSQTKRQFANEVAPNSHFARVSVLLPSHCAWVEYFHITAELVVLQLTVNQLMPAGKVGILHQEITHHKLLELLAFSHPCLLLSWRPHCSIFFLKKNKIINFNSKLRVKMKSCRGKHWNPALLLDIQCFCHGSFAECG